MSPHWEVRLDEPAQNASRQGVHGCRAAKICWRYLMDPFDTSPYGRSARLQTFPDSFVFPNRGRKACAKSGTLFQFCSVKPSAEKAKATLTRNWTTTSMRMPPSIRRQTESGQKPRRAMLKRPVSFLPSERNSTALASMPSTMSVVLHPTRALLKRTRKRSNVTDLRR